MVAILLLLYAPLAAAQAPTTPKHKFSAYLDQTDETEFQEADATTLRGWHAAFIADAQVKPPRQERASPLQLRRCTTR